MEIHNCKYINKNQYKARRALTMISSIATGVNKKRFAGRFPFSRE
jgi:hypothetical protein